MVCAFVHRDNICPCAPKQDHDNAAALANGLGALRGISAERSPGDTNAVYFQVGVCVAAAIVALYKERRFLYDTERWSVG